MKIRVQKEHLAKTVNWYQEQLTKEFGQLALSEAHKEIIKNYFNALHENVKKKEKTNSWQVPLEVEFSEKGFYEVKVVNENKLLYID